MRVAVFFLITSLSYINFSLAFELIAHRGVHQTYARENLTSETCTAVLVDQTGHEFMENTIPSIREAFKLGATMVEFDIHPTTEPNDQISRMVVFHDWTLDCRTDARCNDGCKCNTNGACVTHEQSFDYIRSLDIGYGYTYNNGETFPFRGKYIGMVPSLEEVLDLLYEFPDKKYLVDQKDRMTRTVETFIRIIKKYPEEIRKRVYFPYFDNPDFENELRALGVQESIYQGGGPSKECFKKYLLTGAFGYFPKVCQNQKLFVPIRETMERLNQNLKGILFIDMLWGWPENFIKLAHRHGTKIYPSQVDSKEELETIMKFPVDGLMTNKIEVIGPLQTHSLQ